MGAGLRPRAKATDKPPDPDAGAPVLDSTLQDMDMVGDAVEQRAGEALAGEDRRPFLEGQV